MYTDHFGLTETPFSIAPNPQYLFMSSRHRDALAHLLYGVQSDGGFILLTGEVGTGKTTLCRCLLQQVPTDVELAFVLNPRVTVDELLATVCDEFGINYEAGASVKTLVDKLNEFLLDCHANNRKAVLIIDEAQNLSRDLLEQLRLLTNLETNERKLLQIILLGQPELLEMLEKRDLRQFSQRITARFHLEALKQAETEDYIAHRMSIAGGSGKVFNRAAIRRIYRISKGIPRVINLICDRSLLGAYVEDKTEVTPAIVNKAANEVLGLEKRRSRQQVPLAASLATLALFMLGLLFFLQRDLPGSAPEITRTAEDEASEVTQPLTPPPEKPLPPIRGHRTITEAYHDLFALWGSAFEDRDTHPCELAGSIGLQCLTDSMTLDELQTINRPVIVRIATPGNNDRYLTISSLNEHAVILFAGTEEVVLSHQQFEKLYDGEAHMMWRMPPDYQAPLKSGDTGAAVDWLVVRLSLIEGSLPPLETGYTYNELIEARVRNFQANVGLTPSGIVDPLTWIHINSVEAISIPTLSGTDQG
jgi:general secretion pathway protein A